MFKRISITSIAMLCLIVYCAFMRPSRSHTQEPAKTKVMDYPHAFRGREPVKITTLGEWTFEIKNVSIQAITKFTLHFVAAHAGMPLHGEGAHQHKLPVLWGQDSNQILRPGETVQIGIAEHIKLAAKDPTVDLTNTEIWPFDVYFEGGKKKWMMGKFLNSVDASAGTWKLDLSLNPAQPRIDTGRCFEYNDTIQWPEAFCSGTECPNCKFTRPQFRQINGGVKKLTTCSYCLNSFGSTCQKASGFACTFLGVMDLDFGSPC